jgi:hypothetical protein
MIVSLRTRRCWCGKCDGTGWICEAHHRRPWAGPKACGCGAPGLPCIACNRCEGDDLAGCRRSSANTHHKCRAGNCSALVACVTPRLVGDTQGNRSKSVSSRSGCSKQMIIRKGSGVGLFLQLLVCFISTQWGGDRGAIPLQEVIGCALRRARDRDALLDTCGYLHLAHSACKRLLNGDWLSAVKSRPEAVSKQSLIAMFTWKCATRWD